MRRAVVCLLLLGCSRSKESPSITSEPPPPHVEANSKPAKPKPKPKQLAAHELPVCNTDDPLSALCAIGKDAKLAKFECADPEPIVFCKKVDEWCCKYMAFAGETPPAVTYHARFDHKGPPVKTGEILDMKQFKREGTVRGAEVSFSVATDEGGRQQQNSASEKLLAWGCTERDKGKWLRSFDCGAWEAEVRYNDITRKVYVSAAEAGFLECQ